jgi:methylglutaconyl-CoA hydratase
VSEPEQDRRGAETPENVVRYERRGSVVWLTIDRPDSSNALTFEVLRGLHDGLDRAMRDVEARAIVLTGAGERAFCAGADLKLAAANLRPDPALTTTEYAELLRALMACTLPLVARVNGHCVAGGMGLLAACDLAVTSDRATFGLPEVKVGLFPMQVLSVLRRLVPARLLAEMCLSGEPLTAHEAQAAGLVNYVVAPEELDTKTGWLLARLVDKSPTAQRRGKYAMRAIEGMTWSQALPYLETQLATLALTEDAKEGPRAFVERRAPEWTGR